MTRIELESLISKKEIRESFQVFAEDIIGDREDAEDIVPRAFIRICSNPKKYRGFTEKAVKNCLVKIIRDEARSWKRKHSNQEIPFSRVGVNADGTPSGDPRVNQELAYLNPRDVRDAPIDVQMD